MYDDHLEMQYEDRAEYDDELGEWCEGCGQHYDYCVCFDDDDESYCFGCGDIVYEGERFCDYCAGGSFSMYAMHGEQY